MKVLFGFLIALFVSLLFTACSAVTVADKVHEKGKKAYAIGSKVHKALGVAGKGARKAEDVYLKVKPQEK
ncbi:hypothetical protein [Poseidonibacter sp.]|uniref:hypothetical protein n=1 Tax=Poseidonibacter sp. TaxID=2321188 RepID=UPI003C715835